MDTVELLDRARAAFAARAWHDAYDDLVAADLTAPLEPADLERFGDRGLSDRPRRREHRCLVAGPPGLARAWRRAAGRALCVLARLRSDPAWGDGPGRRLAGASRPNGRGARARHRGARLPARAPSPDGDGGRRARHRPRAVRPGRLARPALRRPGSGRARHARAGRGHAADGTNVGRPAAVRRGDGGGHRRGDLADDLGNRLLRRHRRLPARFRPASRSRVDGGARPVVRRTARARAVPRAVPGTPGAGPAGPWRVGRGGRRGRAGPASVERSTPPGGGDGALPAR